MHRKRRLIVIAKQRAFDEEKWKQLLTAFAYVLHERRKEHEKQEAAQAELNDNAADTDGPEVTQ